jgi:hypothetical protein
MQLISHRLNIIAIVPDVSQAPVRTSVDFNNSKRFFEENQQAQLQNLVFPSRTRELAALTDLFLPYCY